ncbi:MAG TPA: DnaJ domain-containing protein [Rhizomicrobium sp.]|nr:DnaJ domain-containing protein [Rhizomicrobium sp.]
MGEILLGAVALIALIFLLRAFVSADPKALVKALRYVGAAALGLLAVWLFVTDRFAPGMFIASAAWGLFTRGHVWPGGWPHYNFPGRSRSTGQSSGVRTAWLDMELDHDSGDMSGTVLKGAHAGRRLDQLKQDDVVALYNEAAADDPESARLLEAYLDRTFGGDWRGRNHAEDTKPERATTGMSRAEALKVLGLEEGASDDEIRAAHRRLMLQNHPDKGGTDYIAAKINEAKDVLLSR